MQSYFIWNGADSRSMGIILRGPAPIIRPEERVRHVEIPGRSGDLTETQGEGIYNSYIQTVTFSVRGGMRVREVYKWLRGSGYVTFSGEPDRRQAARVIGAITLSRVSRGLDNWAGEAQFYCQPLKELIHPEILTLTGSGTAINRGDVDSLPRITATANGTEMEISAGGNTLVITGLSSGTKIIIDSEIMEITDEDGTELLTKDSTGDFPILKPGANSVTGSGWSRLVIDRRERFL